jgi:hypothetical protein
MNTNQLFRIAGWCALAGAVSTLAAMLSFMVGFGLGVPLEILSLLLMVLVFYALHVAHRSKSKRLSLAGLVLLIVALGVNVAAMLNYGNTILSNLWYLVLALPFLIFGYLGLRSARIPGGLAVLALLAGANFLISGCVGLLGNPEAADSISSFGFLLVMGWEVWLWRVFLSKKFVAV